MSESTTTIEWQPPTREELLTEVRDILVNNPERHQQSIWTSTRFGYETDGFPVEAVRQVARQPIPDQPADPSRPVCGTTGCVAGWTAICGTPPGTVLGVNGFITMPGGERREIGRLAEELLSLSPRQADWLFSGAREDRGELINALNLLIDNPGAPLDDTIRTYTVVVLDENDVRIHGYAVEVDGTWSQNSRVERALNEAYSNH